MRPPFSVTKIALLAGLLVLAIAMLFGKIQNFDLNQCITVFTTAASLPFGIGTMSYSLQKEWAKQYIKMENKDTETVVFIGGLVLTLVALNQIWLFFTH